jgi:monovalent cation:H+ antiporter-2, CPA2 family
MPISKILLSFMKPINYQKKKSFYRKRNLQETGMRKYAARRLGQRFMAIDKASIRKLAKSKDDEDMRLFTTKELLQREEELLAYDNLNFENKDWETSSTDDDDEETQE